jgi:glutaredoxin
MKKIIFLSLMLAIVVTGCSLSKAEKPVVLTVEEAKTKVVDFINKNLMQEGTQISVKEIVQENDLYKVVVNMPNGQEIVSYLTLDGTKFFPQVMDIAEIEKANSGNENKETAATTETTASDVPKNDKPVVELFVMSHCPYGTQIEKGILPVVKTLGDKIDFQLEFCDYAMHGKKELDEQLVQHCISENSPEKLVAYLECFLADETKGPACISSNGIDQSKIDNCVATTDKEYKITELFNDKTTWTSGKFPQFNVYKDNAVKYGVKGSPSLVINGGNVSSGRDSASLLRAVCAAFNTPPAECDTELSSASPSPGFGYNAGGAATDAGCAN